jgi:transcriptional regulator with XRE-family HTH domain
MNSSQELRQFLRSRRERLTPDQVGARVADGARRVPGLRREEVAALAGISVDYYIRLEKGRGLNVSDAVLDGLARALRLNSTERAHLFTLAQSSRTKSRRGVIKPQKVRGGLLKLLETMNHTPVTILGRRLDVLASNAMARALLTDFEALDHRDRNMLRFMFLDESARLLYVNWHQVARELVASLRLDAGKHPHDPYLAELVGELSVADQDFRTWWAEQEVHKRTHGTKNFHHPVVGDLSLDYESLLLPDDPEQRLIIYRAEPGTPSEEALRLLGSWMQNDD